MKKYWLILHQHTFLWVKKNEGLIYGTSDKHLFLRFRNEGIVARIINDLLEAQNLYRTSVTEEELSVREVRELADAIVSSGCGKLVDMEDNEGVTISLKPILKIQDTVSFYQVSHENHRDGKIIQNLLKLIIHLNGSPYGDNDIAKQIIFPKQNNCTLKSLPLIKEFITSMGEPDFLIEIILVGNAHKYPEFQELLQFLQTFSFKLSVYCTEEDFKEDESKHLLVQTVSYHILKTDYNRPPINDNSLSYHFIVSSENEYATACDMIEKYQMRNCRILPVYTEENEEFFKEFVYISEEDIHNLHLSKREIFAHQAINTNLFGTLIIDTDGKVYGDFNSTPLGTIEDGLYMLVYRELTVGHSWLRIRNQKPCCDCIYQWLCPSPSHYEQVIGKQNLCWK